MTASEPIAKAPLADRTIPSSFTLKFLCLGLFAFELLMLAYAVLAAGRSGMTFDRVYFFLYQLVPALAAALSISAAWLSIRSAQARWVGLALAAWIPNACLFVLSGLVSH